mmetsp:Transcript_39219/g.107984  ORF Transcript_39219/g.107984 Transcript_39219/m.107984 type:complete len:369 (-) Transcript_39219:90-1196(-)
MISSLFHCMYRAKTVLKAIYSLYTLSDKELDAFFNSYIIYDQDWENEEQLIKEFGPNYTKVVQEKLVDYYNVLNHLCAIGEVEKMYIPPLMDKNCKSLIGNQNLFEERMCRDLNIVDGKGLKVLDIGCGRGRVANHVSSYTGASVTGVNVDPYQLGSAKRWTEFTGNPCTFKFHDVNTIPFPFPDNSLDAVYQIQVFSLSKDLLKLFKEIYRMLKPGARLSCLDWVVLDAYDPNNAEHVEMMSRVKPLIGAIGCPSSKNYVKLMKEAGFNIVIDENPSVGGYQAPLIENADDFYVGLTKWVKFLCKWHLIPAYFEKLFDRLTKDGEALVKMDRDDLVTTTYYMVAEKPLKPGSDSGGESPTFGNHGGC